MRDGRKNSDITLAPSDD